MEETTTNHEKYLDLRRVVLHYNYSANESFSIGLLSLQAGENELKLIPVIDILDGIVVHAVRGRRKEYLPLKSVLCASADPIDVAAALRACSLSELYVADLDAIAGEQPNFSLLRRIVDKTGFNLMVDAGISALEKAEMLRNYVSKVVIGTETLPNTSFLAEAVERLGSERVIVSLDLMRDKVLSAFNLGELSEPLTFLRELISLGVSQIIILDLARVGSGEGVNMSFLREVQSTIEAKVFVGGGVRDVKDLLELKDMGIFGVLVATALHSGEISPYRLEQSGLL